MTSHQSDTNWAPQSPKSGTIKIALPAPGRHLHLTQKQPCLRNLRMLATNLITLYHDRTHDSGGSVLPGCALELLEKHTA